MHHSGYDIFISYRRDDGRQYARLVERELKSEGFHVFLDYEELKDGIFENTIVSAISSAKIFMMILTPKYLERCSDEKDWVRKEIMLAYDHRLHFVPLVPDSVVKSFPPEQTCTLPEEINSAVLKEQWSEVSFGGTMEATFSQMVKDRILKYVKPHGSRRRRTFRVVSCLTVIGAAAFIISMSVRKHEETIRHALMTETFHEIPVCWDARASTGQLKAVNDILSQMIYVKGSRARVGAEEGEADAEPYLETPVIEVDLASFYIGKYEVSTYQWCTVMDVRFDGQDALKPKTDVSYDECIEFTHKLFQLTGLRFSLPTEAEWEYAARGGESGDGTRYSGSDEAGEVAWYEQNSGLVRHECDARSSKMRCNSLDIHDMSGNVSEWCQWMDSPYRLYGDMSDGRVSHDIIYNDNIQPHRGGAYDSEAWQVTVFHREFADRAKGTPNTGLRLLIHIPR